MYYRLYKSRPKRLILTFGVNHFTLRSVFEALRAAEGLVEYVLSPPLRVVLQAIFALYVCMVVSARARHTYLVKKGIIYKKSEAINNTSMTYNIIGT